MSEQNFPKFRCLLSEAICTKSQAQFAKEANISAEHLNRMLNATAINRPSKSTLKKIAAIAANGITYQDLESALNEEDPNYHKVDYDTLKKEAKYREACEDFTLPFEERADECFSTLASYINEVGPGVYDDLNSFVEDVISKCKEKMNEPFDISYLIGTTRPYFGHCSNSDKISSDGKFEYTSVYFNITDDDLVAHSEMVVYTNIVPALEPSVLVFSASMYVYDIFDIYGLCDSMLSKFEDGEDILNSPDGFNQVMEQPYYIQIEPKKNYSRLNEKVLLDRILHPIEDRRLSCASGMGFYLDKIPDDFYKFIEKHKDAILQKYHKHPDLFAEMESDIDKVLSSETDDKTKQFIKLFADECDGKVSDDDDYYCRQLVARIMTVETGFPFSIIEHSSIENENEEKYKDDIDDRDCIIIEDRDIEDYNIQKKTLLNILSRYGRELGIERFGELRYSYIETYYTKPETYVINYNKKEPVYKNDDVDTENWNSMDIKPEKNEAHLVLLKDGRTIPCCYIGNVGKNGEWVYAHKSWTDVIAKWNPEPIVLDKNKKD